MDEYVEKLRDYIFEKADSKQSAVLLFLISFTEASFFIIPPDIILIAILMVAPQRWLKYTNIAVVASVLGGILGYIIGFFLFDLVGEFIVNTYNLHDQMTTVGEKFADNAFWTIFVSAFTPIPYKVFTIAAGFFKIDLVTFVIASFLGRGLRMYVVGYVMNKFGAKTGQVIYRYFNIFLIAIPVIIVAALLFI